jgi:hypothetical protein
VSAFEQVPCVEETYRFISLDIPVSILPKQTSAKMAQGSTTAGNNAFKDKYVAARLKTSDAY